jgi:uncharacterized protein (TIRG00374 family)
LIPVVITVVLVGALLRRVDLDQTLATLRGADVALLVGGLALFIPTTLLSAWRWVIMVRPLAPLPLGESVRQVLAGSTLNLILPSKLGDLAKGVFVYRQGRCALGEGIQIVVFEKLLDLAGLSTLLLVGWCLMPGGQPWLLATLALALAIVGGVGAVYFLPRERSLLAALVPLARRRGRLGARIAGLIETGPRVMALVQASAERRLFFAVVSIAIWFLHLVQIHLLFLSVGAGIGFVEMVARMPVAIFAGLLPLTVAGFGTRDWAILAVFASAARAEETLVAGALLFSLRYVVPAVAGLPFIGRAMALAQSR